MSVPRPENIGDIYKATDYPSIGEVSYGVVFLGYFPNGESLWYIEMDDGDIFAWRDDMGQPDIMGATLELVRRNPLPAREVAL